jgi:hypothetical protein
MHFTESSKCLSPSLIENLSTLKYINYNFKTLSQERPKVSGLYLVSKENE